MSRTFSDATPFPEGARVALANPQLRRNLRAATTTIREKRNLRVGEMERWEDLRLAAEAIKGYSIDHLDGLLAAFEVNLTRAGGHVHWARDAAEARRIVQDLVRATGTSDVVKIKSMTSAEIDLNGALDEIGVRAYETDLAELIVQLGDDLPSHIVVPAIHRNRDEVRDIFLTHMGEWGRPAPADLSNRPSDLAAAARAHLREKFLRARVAVSGANFLIADTGAVAIVESEGNGRMCLTLPDTLITVAGIDKIIPSFEDLDVLFQVLPRSATGERMNPYNSVWTGVTPGDGPQEFHVVLLDNGRSRARRDRVGRAALRCIRCAACLNVCPVYERVGGHAYGSVYPGPIGAVLTPQLDHVANDDVADSLPFASTLCGACFDACPVRIDIPQLLVHLRGEVVKRGQHPGPERGLMTGAAWLFRSPARVDLLARLGSLGGRLPALSRLRVPGWIGRWSVDRTLPLPVEGSFAAWWRRSGRPVVSSAPGSEPPRETREHLDARRAVLDALAGPTATTYEVIPRAYRDLPTLTTEQRRARFVERLEDYHARVHLCDESHIADAIREALDGRSSHRVVVPSSSLAEWIPGEYDVLVDRDTSTEELDAVDAVLTTATVAIAETGTIVLTAAPDEGRRALTLIPDHHVVVVRESHVVDQVPDAISRLDPTRPQTWFSGPSATSDIELSRVDGVHGPRQLDVVVVLDSPLDVKDLGSEFS